MRRAFALLACALVLAGAAAGTAVAAGQSEFDGHRRQIFPVVVVPWLTRADLPDLAARGAAVGLLVPNAGPTTSAGDAFAGMVRGILYNARLAKPSDTVLIRVVKSYALPARGPAIVLSLPPARKVPNTKRYPIAVLGRGYHGVLVSKLTRVPGLVSMADVARTALGTTNRLRAKPSADPAGVLRRLEAHVVSSRSSTMAASVLVLSLLVCFALLYPAGAPAALGSALLANVGLGWLGGTDPVANVVLVGVCVVAGGLLGARLLRSRLALGGALAAVVAVYGVAMAVHPPALSLAPMGPELTSRFFGVSNLIETLLLGPALLAGRLLGTRLGRSAFAATALLTLVAIAENRLGADGGGAIVVGVAFAVLGVGIYARRKLEVVPALAVAGLAAFLLLDLDAASRGPDHLRGALHGGLNGLVRVAANRVPLSYSRMVDQWWLVFPALAAVAVGAAAVRFARSRADAALVVALLCGLGASLLVNDSPGAVAIAGLGSLLALENGLVHRGLLLARQRLRTAPTAPPRLAPVPATRPTPRP